MELNLQNKLQHQIADLLWEAKDRERIKDIIKVYGVDAVIVLNMMLAAYYDEVDAIDLVEPILQKYRL
jgi:hypothetical protein